MFYHYNIRCTISVKNSVSFNRECLCTFYRFFVCLAVGRDKLCCLDNINRIFYQISMYQCKQENPGVQSEIPQCVPISGQMEYVFQFY